MKKKGFAVLAMVLAFGALTVNVWAEEGWKQSGNTYVYYDSGGNRVTYSWKKGADNQWRYLNGAGEMAVNSWVENTYYVDHNGLMLTDQWKKLSDGGKDQWYYFSSSGKSVMDAWKKIDNKWYYFDGNGAMQTGWVLDDMYYCGSDGTMRTGWQKLIPPDSDYHSDYVSPDMEEDDGRVWYYFGSTGKKYVPTSMDGEYSVRRIDGVYYCFDSNGAMQTGWRRVEDDNDPEIKNYKFFDSSGRVRTGWYSAEPPKDLDGYEDEVEWFYFSSNGTPKSGPDTVEASTNDLFKINGKTYLFNQHGNPVYGLQKVSIGNSDSVYTAYYFGTKAQSSVQRGRQDIEEGDGTVTEFYFSDSGRGYTGVKDSRLYYMGKLQKAEEGLKYSIISLPTGSGFTNYVVNASGRVVKSTSVKDAEGNKYKTGGNGVLLKINDEEPSGSYLQPSEPVWNR